MNAEERVGRIAGMLDEQELHRRMAQIAGAPGSGLANVAPRCNPDTLDPLPPAPKEPPMPTALATLAAAATSPGAASNAAYHAAPLTVVSAIVLYSVEAEAVVPWELTAWVCGCILAWDALRFGARQLGKWGKGKAA